MKQIISLILIFLCGCSGYHLDRRENPFEYYNISSISVPYFINYTPLQNISNHLTVSMINFLRSYPGIEVYEGEVKEADAYLVGVIEPARNFEHPITSEGQSNITVYSHGNKKELNIPNTQRVSVRLNLYLIKKGNMPLKSLTFERDHKIYFKGPDLLLQHTYELTSVTALNYADYQSRGRFYSTQIAGGHEVLLKKLSQQMLDNFQEKVLYAY